MKPLGLAFISLVALGSSFGCRHSAKVPAQVTDAEYRVLSAYATGKFKSITDVQQLVIFGETQIFSETQAVRDDLDSISDANEAIRALRATHRPLFRAFFEVNRQSSNFHRSFTLPVPYQIVDSPEMHSIFGTPGDVWGRYYEKYPGSSGILVLSRVGFSPGRTSGGILCLEPLRRPVRSGVFRNDGEAWHFRLECLARGSTVDFVRFGPLFLPPSLPFVQALPSLPFLVYSANPSWK